MAIGKSGRIVLEIDPALKKEIYVSLNRTGLSLKEWFLEAVRVHLLEGDQLTLNLRPPKARREGGSAV